MFVNCKPEPGQNPNPTQKARPDLKLCIIFQFLFLDLIFFVADVDEQDNGPIEENKQSIGDNLQNKGAVSQNIDGNSTVIGTQQSI